MTHHTLLPTLIEPSLIMQKISSQIQFGVENKRMDPGWCKDKEIESLLTWTLYFQINFKPNQIWFGPNIRNESN